MYKVVFCAFLKIIILVFLGFIFGIHKLQNDNPSCDRDNIIKSSA